MLELFASYLLYGYSANNAIFTYSADTIYISSSFLSVNDNSYSSVLGISRTSSDQSALISWSKCSSMEKPCCLSILFKHQSTLRTRRENVLCSRPGADNSVMNGKYSLQKRGIGDVEDRRMLYKTEEELALQENLLIFLNWL